MTYRSLAAALAVALLPVFAPLPAAAGPVERACNASGRQQATRSLCACVQRVADTTLSRADQRRAVRLFEDPHEAQEIRQSDRPADEAFWARYRAFGEMAESYCAGS